MSRKQLINLLSILAFIFIGIALFITFKNMKKPPKVSLPQKTVRSVHTIPVIYNNLPGTIETSGRIKAFDEIIISSEVSGRLVSSGKEFKSGVSFLKGEIIAKVENDEFLYQLMAQRSRFMQSMAASLADIKIDFPDSYNSWTNFFESLHSDKNMPDMPQINDSKERVFLASRNILNDYYSIKGNEARMEKHSIRAPYNGSLKEVNMQVGSVVNAGVRLGTFTRTDLFELEVPVAYENISIIKPGMLVRIKNRKGEFYQNGTIDRIAKVVNAATQSVSVYISIPNSTDHPLYDGLYLSAVIEGKTINNVMSVPRDAIFNGHFVNLLQDRRLVAHPVEKVFYNYETIYIKGLPEESQVVIEPIMGITDYMEFESIQ